jgi:hypothetical protein
MFTQIILKDFTVWEKHIFHDMIVSLFLDLLPNLILVFFLHRIQETWEIHFTFSCSFTDLSDENHEYFMLKFRENGKTSTVFFISKVD